jgi:hypothetical protein
MAQKTESRKMIVTIIKPYWKWKKGQEPDLTEELAYKLIESGYAVISGDQTRRDYIPKPKQETEPQKIEVNNFYLPPGYDGEGFDRPSFFDRLKSLIWQR